MRNAATGKPLRPLSYTEDAPEVFVPFDRLAEIQARLDAHGMSYTVDEETMSLDDGPEEILISFQRGTDPAKLLRLLDSLE